MTYLSTWLPSKKDVAILIDSGLARDENPDRIGGNRPQTILVFTIKDLTGVKQGNSREARTVLDFFSLIALNLKTNYVYLYVVEKNNDRMVQEKFRSRYSRRSSGKGCDHVVAATKRGWIHQANTCDFATSR